MAYALLENVAEVPFTLEDGRYMIMPLSAYFCSATLFMDDAEMVSAKTIPSPVAYLVL